MTYVSLDELVERADLVSLHVPLLDSTRHIIGAEQLSRMKPTACLVNTARAAWWTMQRCSRPSKRGSWPARAWTVWRMRPPKSPRALTDTPNVLITPHIGGSTADLADAMIPTIAQIIKRLRRAGS